jgi:hypothetical protein
MIYKISHSFALEIFVPWLAIGHNLDFMRTQDGQPVVMSDGIQAEVISVKEVHILSEEAQAISIRLYSISAIALMVEWYKRLPIMSTMFFCNIKLRQFVNPIEPIEDATPVPE